MHWKKLFEEERGESSKGNGKNREELFVNDFHEEGWNDDDGVGMELEQLKEILRLQTSDHPGMQLVATTLTGTNFLNWSRAIKRALGAKSKLEILDGTLGEPDPSVFYYKQWVKVDYMVSSWITNSISRELVNSFSHYTTTKKLWDALCRRFDRSNGQK